MRPHQDLHLEPLPLEAACACVSLTPCGLINWSGTSVMLRVSRRPKRRGFLSSSCPYMNWWVVSVTLRRWSGRTSALQTARDLYAANNPVEMVAVRGMPARQRIITARSANCMAPERQLHHDWRAYETPSVLNLPAFRWKNGGPPGLRSPHCRVQTG